MDGRLAMTYTRPMTPTKGAIPVNKGDFTNIIVALGPYIPACKALKTDCFQCISHLFRKKKRVLLDFP